MSKQLGVFTDILRILSAVTGFDVDTDSEHIKIVKQALQRLEAIDNAEPSEALGALEDIILYLNASEPKGLYCENIETIQQALLKAEKEHKALEIIKEKGCDISWFKYCIKYCIKENLMVKAYNSGYHEYDKKLTKEQFNLLKEVLE